MAPLPLGVVSRRRLACNAFGKSRELRHELGEDDPRRPHAATQAGNTVRLDPIVAIPTVYL